MRVLLDALYTRGLLSKTTYLNAVDLAYSAMDIPPFFRYPVCLAEGQDAPSRLHSIYVSDKDSLYHWLQYIGNCSRLFEVQVDGDVFVSSDFLFPDFKASFEEQVLASIEYWQPKKLTKTSPKEYLVQGKIEIKGEMEI